MPPAHAFAELRGLLACKAALGGSGCISVDADYTSQTCPRCGYTSRKNRPQHGLRFLCQHCQVSLHADLVGKRPYLLASACHPAGLDGNGKARQVSAARSDREAKTARLLEVPGDCGGVWPQARLALAGGT